MQQFMTYNELCSRFREHERNNPNAEPLHGAVLISQSSFTEEYSEASRTYEFSSRNKAFMPNMGGYSIFASSVDGTDPGVRLEAYLAVEHGGKDGWQIEKCWLETKEE